MSERMTPAGRGVHEGIPQAAPARDTHARRYQSTRGQSGTCNLLYASWPPCLPASRKEGMGKVSRSVWPQGSEGERGSLAVVVTRPSPEVRPRPWSGSASCRHALSPEAPVLPWPCLGLALALLVVKHSPLGAGAGGREGAGWRGAAPGAACCDCRVRGRNGLIPRAHDIAVRPQRPGTGHDTPYPRRN